MIPISPRIKSIVGLCLVAAVAALQALVKVDPALVWAGGVVQLLIAAELYFTVPTSALPAGGAK